MVYIAAIHTLTRRLARHSGPEHLSSQMGSNDSLTITQEVLKIRFLLSFAPIKSNGTSGEGEKA